MRARGLTALAVGATLIVAAISLGPVAIARSTPPTHPVTAGHGRAARATSSPSATLLYTQQSNDTGHGYVSQDFEPQFDAYDAGADDFTIPQGHTWKITEIDVTGQYFNGSGPCRDETVTFYKNGSGHPSTIIAAVEAAGIDRGGSLQIPLKVVIKARRQPRDVWVSVVCNMDFKIAGEWGWEARSIQGGAYRAQWENPDGGYGLGCTTWRPMQTCLGAGRP